jgi:hypothetical protein
LQDHGHFESYHTVYAWVWPSSGTCSQAHWQFAGSTRLWSAAVCSVLHELSHLTGLCAAKGSAACQCWLKPFLCPSLPGMSGRRACGVTGNVSQQCQQQGCPQGMPELASINPHGVLTCVLSWCRGLPCAVLRSAHSTPPAGQL